MKKYKNIAFFAIIGIVFLGINHPLKSQSFSYHSDLPFNIDLIPLIPGEVTLKLIFADRDNDNDLDVFHMGFRLDSSEIFSFSHFLYFIDYQENIGTRNMPNYANRKRAFDSFYFPEGPFLPSIGDLNNDNKLDFIAHAEIEFLTEAQSMIIYQNIGNNSADEFEVLDGKNFGLKSLLPWSFLWPELVDLDSDGDLDILSSGNIPADFIFENLIPIANYAKNVGTPENPEFISWFENPYNIKTDTLEEIMKSADIDNDGDVDILSMVNSDGINTIHFKENQMKEGKPYFAEGIEHPFGLPMPDSTVAFIDLILADFDGDGDTDVYILTVDDDENTGGFSLALYENDLCAVNEVNLEISICDGEEFEGYTDEGSYFDVFQAENGCDSMRTLELTVLPNSQNDIDFGLCQGDSIIVGSQSYDSSGMYSIYLLNSYGCDSLIELSIEVFTIDTSLSISENTLSVSSEYHEYQWIDCDTGLEVANENSYIFQPSSSGNYAVEIIDVNGCMTYSDCYEVIISNTTETNELAIQIYPNPNSGVFVIDNQSEKTIAQTNVYDLNSKLVNKQTTFKKQIDYSYLDEGIYILEIIFKDQTRKVFKISILK